jgi:hypothetical protein
MKSVLYVFALALLVCLSSNVSNAAALYGVDISGCSFPSVNGAGTTSVSTPPGSGGVGTTSAAASSNLANGTISVTASALAGHTCDVNADFYDTLTFTGIPSSGAMVTLSFPLAGSVVGSPSVGSNAYGTVYLEVAGPNYPSTQHIFAANSVSVGQTSGAVGLPDTATISFLVFNGDIDEIYIQLVGTANGGTAGASINLDPGLSLTLSCAPTCGYTSASGVFLSSTSSGTTPEPSSIALVFTGMLGLAGALRRKFLA